MKVIFIGNPIKEKILGKDKEYRYTSYADNFMQLKFINEISNIYGKDLNVITINYNNKKIYKKGKLNNIDTTFIKYHPMNSWTYYLSFMFNVFKELLKVCKKHKKEKLVVITNGPYMYYSLPMIIARLFHKFKYICYLVCSVELPQYKGIYGLVAKMSKYLIKSADATITYVEKSSIDYTKKPYISINYYIDENKVDLFDKYIKKNKKSKKKINITYTGALTYISGVEEMIKMIDKLPDNYVLNICGSGECEEKIKQYQKEKPEKLNYLGLLSQEEVIDLQIKADILVVFRNKENKKNKYYANYAGSSKITEYLLSGNPIITNEHGALDEKLKPYLNVVKSTDSDYLKEYIINLSKSLNSAKMLDKCKKGRDYIISNCIEGAQSKKICDFIEKIGKSK